MSAWRFRVIPLTHIDTINNFNWNVGIRIIRNSQNYSRMPLASDFYSLLILFHIPHLRQRSVGRLSFRDLFAPLPSLPQIPKPGGGWSRWSPGHSGTKWFSSPSMFRPNFNLFHCFGLAVYAIINTKATRWWIKYHKIRPQNQISRPLQYAGVPSAQSDNLWTNWALLRQMPPKLAPAHG